jgi:phosphoglycolate phosphatase
MDIKNYTHILWDWNGTLFDDVELCRQLINELLTEYSLPEISLKQYRDIFTFPVKDYYAKAGLDLKNNSFEELGKRWMKQYELRKISSSLFPFTNNVLEKIKELNIEQSILSAYSENSLVSIVEHYGINEYFSHIAGLDHIYATSKVDIGKELIKKIGNGKGTVLMIGDTEHDYEVASEIGADCILIVNGHQCKEKLTNCGIEVFDSMEQLLNDLEED